VIIVLHISALVKQYPGDHFINNLRWRLCTK